MLKNRFIVILSIFYCSIISCSKEISHEIQKDSVKIKIAWEYNEFPLRIKLYEPASQRNFRYWETGIVNDEKKLPVSSPIDNETLYIKRGGKKLFVLVVHNNGSEARQFFAAPHSVDPPELSFGFKFKCLCVNHAFRIQPGEFWYRVVELRISEKFKGNEIEIRHNIIGITEARMNEIEKERLNETESAD